MKAVALLLVLVGTAQAQVVVAPMPVQVQPVIEPAFPAQFQDVSVGYRHEEAPGFSGNGFALRAVIGVPGWIVDGEGMMSGAWGYQGTNLAGHAQISIALRLTPFNKFGHVRPYVLAAPLVDITRVSSDEQYAFGANGGAGVDWVWPGLGPGLVSIDVRGGQAWNVKSQDWSGWQLLATVSIGAHEELNPE